MQRNTKKPMTRDRNLDKTVLWLCVAALVILSILVWWFFLGGASLVEQKKMEMYLKDKYGKEFVVGKPERKASGLGVEGYLESSANPREQSDLGFEVWSYSNNIEDNYPFALWRDEKDEEVRSFLTNLFGYTPSYKINFYDPDHYIDRIKGEVPSFQSVLLLNSSIHYEIQTTVDASSTPDLQKEADRVYEILKFSRNKNGDSSKIGVRYIINEKKSNRSFICQYYEKDGYAKSASDITGCFNKYDGME